MARSRGASAPIPGHECLVAFGALPEGPVCPVPPAGGAVTEPPPEVVPVEPVLDVVTVVVAVVPELAEAPAIPAAAPPVARAAPTIAAVNSLGLVMCFGPPGLWLRVAYPSSVARLSRPWGERRRCVRGVASPAAAAAKR